MRVLKVVTETVSPPKFEWVMHMCMSNHACVAQVCVHLCTEELLVHFMSCEDTVCFTDV